MSFKRGMTPIVTPTVAQPQPSQVIGRAVRPSVVSTPTPPAPVQRVIATPQPQRHHEPPVRGLLVDGVGRPLRGLSQATIDAHKAHTANESELCTNCGKMRTPQQMKTIVGNAYNASNPVRICDVPGDPTSCAQLAYKDPHKADARWTPRVPAIRFDRETAAPYDARERGVTVQDLIKRDTYHNEREVSSAYRQDSLQGEGVWSGGGRAGHQVTASTVAQSRERAHRTRR